MEVKIVENIADFSDKKIIAFSGSSHAESFFTFLRENGLNIAETKVFSERNSYAKDDLKDLLTLAESQNAELVTTKKDWNGLPQELKGSIKSLDFKAFLAPVANRSAAQERLSKTGLSPDGLEGLQNIINNISGGLKRGNDERVVDYSENKDISRGGRF